MRELARATQRYRRLLIAVWLKVFGNRLRSCIDLRLLQSLYLLALHLQGTLRNRNRLGDRRIATMCPCSEFVRLIKKAEVKAIIFHGLCHDCATLALKEGDARKRWRQSGWDTSGWRLRRTATRMPSPPCSRRRARVLGKLLHG